MRVLIVSLLGIALLVSNCTIQKRIYRKGFHIEWKKKINEAIAVKEPAVQYENVSTFVSAKNDSSGSIVATVSENLAWKDDTLKTVKIEVSNNKEINYEEQVSSDQYTVQKKQNKLSPATPSDEEVAPQQKKHFEPFGIFAFGFSLAAISMLFFELGYFLSYPFAIMAAIFILLAFVSGSISIARTKKNKGKYRRNDFGILGFIFATVLLGCTLLVLLGVFLG
ncbi:hypothetical protein [Fluviicola sp.]|uniref:hypothetical protein n=1 Tax=Fluviicola sp. TaxID=1917219 RepID=UPI00282A13FB|nr:hypothetical protein [Fluviicola sp.]MDR0802085.1 hypothetical protein [Fluviicola sp.]